MGFLLGTCELYAEMMLNEAAVLASNSKQTALILFNLFMLKENRYLNILDEDLKHTVRSSHILSCLVRKSLWATTTELFKAGTTKQHGRVSIA